MHRAKWAQCCADGIAPEAEGCVSLGCSMVAASAGGKSRRNSVRLWGGISVAGVELVAVAAAGFGAAVTGVETCAGGVPAAAGVAAGFAPGDAVWTAGMVAASAGGNSSRNRVRLSPGISVAVAGTLVPGAEACCAGVGAADGGNNSRSRVRRCGGALASGAVVANSVGDSCLRLKRVRHRPTRTAAGRGCGAGACRN